MSVPLPSYSQHQDREALNNPEKWYVRHTWRRHAEKRAKKTSKKFVKFLTLPGIECFDIRLLSEYGLIKTTDTGFDSENLAYCEEIKERYAQIGNLLPNARRYLGTYEDLVGVGKAGFTFLADKWFPFDVINLDFSGPGFNQPGRNTSRTAEALSKTFKLQAVKRSSFSLFLTLPADIRKNDQSGKNQLEKCLRDNLTGEETQEFSKIFGEKYPGLRSFQGQAYKKMRYEEFLMVTVPKLIIKYGLEEWFLVTCNEKITYQGEGHATRMVAFCFDCEYVGLHDGYGGNPRTRELHDGYSRNVTDVLRKSNVDINKLFNSELKLKAEYSRIRDEARKLFGTKLKPSSSLVVRALKVVENEKKEET